MKQGVLSLMNNDNIIAGVGIGGLTDKYDIKILICYLINSIEHPITKEQLDYIMHDGQFANYFSFCNAYSELLESGHIEEVDGIIKLNELGELTTKKLQTNLPKSLRDNIVDAAIGLLASIKYKTENEVNIEPYKNGYLVKCIIHDTDFDLLSFEIYAPDILQAEKIKEKFWQDPAKLYQNLIGYLIF